MTVSGPTNRNWEAVFGSWSQAPSQTETEKAENAERAVTNAIADDDVLAEKSIRVFAQGSYRARTNVRQDSDVDVCVCLQSPFITQYDDGLSDSDFGFVNADYTAANFKNDVERALIAHFGADAVDRGTKAFDVHENSYRIDADVVPALEYRWYYKLGEKPGLIVGTALFPDGGNRIENFPDHNYDNGVTKNTRTNRRYKRIVRILKRLRNEMADARIKSAAAMSSYLIECLTWNVPNELFVGDTFRPTMQLVLGHLWAGTKEESKCAAWLEVNQIKYLFHPKQPWTREQAHTFIDDAWDYVGVDS